jgi:hypothetical protein
MSTCKISHKTDILRAMCKKDKKEMSQKWTILASKFIFFSQGIKYVRFLLKQL